VIFVVLAGVIVWVRRSQFGHRLLAHKDSPAACATLGMNSRVSTLAVFALSAAIAGIGGGVYGQALGSAAPDVYQFFTGLTVLLAMVVFGISAVGSGVGAGMFLGGPTLANIFPGLTQLQAVLVGGAGIGVGTSPNGTIPSGLRPVWSSVVRRPVVLVGVLVVIAGAWVLRVAGVLDNWTLTGIIAGVLIFVPAIAYAVDYRRGDAPAAFGLPARTPRPSDAPQVEFESYEDSTAIAEPMSSPAGAGSHGA
jgi:branched-chain amino acid transport system permease protein